MDGGAEGQGARPLTLGRSDRDNRRTAGRSGRRSSPLPADLWPPAHPQTARRNPMSFWTDLRTPSEQELLIGFYDLSGYMRFAETTEPSHLLELMAGYFAVTGR